MDEEEKTRKLEDLGQKDLRKTLMESLKAVIETSTSRDGKDEDYTEAVEDAQVTLEYAQSVLDREKAAG